MIRDIERNDWVRFFESFTMAHDRWLVHVDGENDSQAPGTFPIGIWWTKPDEQTRR